MRKKEKEGVQVLYLGRYVDKSTFCAFVYSHDGEKLAKSYQEYEDLLASGVWFSSKDEVKAPVVAEKKKSANKKKSAVTEDELTEEKENKPIEPDELDKLLDNKQLPKDNKPMDG